MPDKSKGLLQHPCIPTDPENHATEEAAEPTADLHAIEDSEHEMHDEYAVREVDELSALSDDGEGEEEEEQEEASPNGDHTSAGAEDAEETAGVWDKLKSSFF